MLDTKTRIRIEPVVQRVLVVDPNQASARLIVDIMKGVGAREVVMASSRKQAMQAASELEPGVIFIESAGPEFNGAEFARDLRRSALECRRAPVIMVTADATASIILGARDSGVHEFLRKPFTSGDLLRRVENVATRPRDWIEGINYVGPDRRRFNSGEYDGPRKRGSDKTRTEAQADIDAKEQALNILAAAFEHFDKDPHQALRSARQQALTLKALAMKASDARLAVAAGGLEKALGAGATTRTELAAAIQSVLVLAAARPPAAKAG